MSHETSPLLMTEHGSLLASGKTGRDHFQQIYQATLVREADWLRRTAANKADSVTRLLERNGLRPHRVLELGCGTGAVIGELADRGVAEEYYAVDYSEQAIRYLRETQPALHAAVADVTATPDPFGQAPYAIVLLSHVLEHLEEPAAFLRAVRRMDFSYLIAEVPLEDLPFGRLKALVKDRRDNPAGHVQFFTRRSFRALLTSAGFTIVGERRYAPVLDKETLRFAYGRGSRKALTEHYLPRFTAPLWSRFFHAHYALLCRKAV